MCQPKICVHCGGPPFSQRSQRLRHLRGGSGGTTGKALPALWEQSMLEFVQFALSR